MSREYECEWVLEDVENEIWESECGLVWSFETGTPQENDMNFCPKCGNKLIILEGDC